MIDTDGEFITLVDNNGHILTDDTIARNIETITDDAGMNGAHCSRLARNVWEGTAKTTTSAPAQATAGSTPR